MDKQQAIEMLAQLQSDIDAQRNYLLKAIDRMSAIESTAKVVKQILEQSTDNDATN